MTIWNGSWTNSNTTAFDFYRESDASSRDTPAFILVTMRCFLFSTPLTKRIRYELTPESRAHINFREQRQFGSLWKLLSELPDEPGVIPEEFRKPHWEDDK